MIHIKPEMFNWSGPSIHAALLLMFEFGYVLTSGWSNGSLVLLVGIGTHGLDFGFWNLNAFR